MPDNNKREVNDDTEILDLEDDVETPDKGDDEDLEEVVIPPVDETEDKEPEDKTPTDSSPEDKEPEDEPAPEADPKPDSVPSKPAPKPVEGETPREKALRQEVQRVKGLLRGKNVQDLIDPEVPAPKSEDELQELRDLGYSEEEIANMEKAIDVIAKKKGYVKQSDNYQAQVNDTVAAFIEANPEYKPENDVEDIRWSKFHDILKSGVYNVSGKTPKQLQVIFNKVHQDVIDELGEPETTVQTKKVAAAQHKVRTASHSGGTKTTPTKPAKPAVDPSVRNHFKGFDDEDFEDAK